MTDTINVIFPDLDPSFDVEELTGDVQQITLEGPPGPSGGEPDVYAVTSVSSWTHAHSRDYPPLVRLVDSSNHWVIADVTYPDSSHVSLSFPTPFTGTIYVS